MKTPGRRARSDSRSPTRNLANRSAKIDADIAVKMYRAKFGKVTSRDGIAAALATEHSITQKAVRDVWNLRTWAAATRPLWNAEDREKWAQIKGHGKEAPSAAQFAPEALESQKLWPPWLPGLQGPLMPAQAGEGPSACLTVGRVPDEARDGCRGEKGMACSLASYLTPAGMPVMRNAPSRPLGEQMRTCSSEARRAMMMEAARWQPLKVATRHQLDWLQNTEAPELGYDALAFERRTYHAEQSERVRSFASGTARCRHGTFPPADVLSGVNLQPRAGATSGDDGSPSRWPRPSGCKLPAAQASSGLRLPAARSSSDPRLRAAQASSGFGRSAAR